MLPYLLAISLIVQSCGKWVLNLCMGNMSAMGFNILYGDANRAMFVCNCIRWIITTHAHHEASCMANPNIKGISECLYPIQQAVISACTKGHIPQQATQCHTKGSQPCSVMYMPAFVVHQTSVYQSHR